MEADRAQRLLRLQEECRRCTRCVQDGILDSALPIFEGPADARFMLVGQAPGPVELGTRRPFTGRAGAELERWMVRAGFASGEDFRRHTYIAAVMRCFPGRNPDGKGDRRPPALALANCAPWLEAELELLRPAVVIAAGQLAIARFLGSVRLDDVVGSTFGSDPVVVPLPHPSGQSRWLNSRVNRGRLERALAALAGLRQRYIETG